MAQAPCLSSGSFGTSRGSIGSRSSSGFNGRSFSGRLAMDPDFVTILSDSAAVTASDSTHGAILAFSLVVELIDTATDTVSTDREAQAAPQVKGLLIQVTLQLTDRAGQAAPGTQTAYGVLEAGAEVVFVTVLVKEVEGRARHVAVDFKLESV